MWFGFGGGSSDDDGFDDDGFFSFASDGPSTSRARYTSYARKSSAAERRESQGRSKFCAIQNEVEEEGVATGKRAHAAADGCPTPAGAPPVVTATPPPHPRPRPPLGVAACPILDENIYLRNPTHSLQGFVRRATCWTPHAI